MSPTQAYVLLVLVVACERLVELVVSRRNLRWSLARGGVEYGRGHFAFMVILHTGLLVGCLVEVWLVEPTPRPALAWSMLVLVLAS